MSACRRDFDETKYVFFIEVVELLKKYNEIWEKVSNSIKKDFDKVHSEPVYNEKIAKN